jgi:predicted O-methyltransferase YrrM
MHASSYEQMSNVLDRLHSRLLATAPTRVLDVGSMDVNGSYRSLFEDLDVEYTGVDLEPGPGVDLVLTDAGALPFDDGSFDLVLSGQMLEHAPRFWETFSEMTRVLSSEGILVLIAPSNGPIHRFPVDCYRFHPDAFQALADLEGLQLLEVSHDERGPWKDVLGIFSRTDPGLPSGSTRPVTKVVPRPLSPEPGAEQLRGQVPYLDVLRALHERVKPSHYLEIGVRHGASMRLAQGRATGIDPAPEVTSVPDHHRIFEMPSDEFFATKVTAALTELPSLSFIDGLHTFEQTLRDFMNIERNSPPDGVVVVDDVLPNHPAQAQRERRTAAWCGTVWKFTEILRELRPDLTLELVDAAPCGLLIVTGLDASNRVLWEAYNPLVRRWRDTSDDPPTHVLQRSDAVGLGEITLAGRGPAPLRALSVVVVSYNMQRELPRTLRSLSTLNQRGIAQDEYEVLVVDNGSKEQLDRDAIQSLPINVRFLDVAQPTQSPVAAVNLGLSEADGELLGVMIDGARMASPRLLAHARDAHRAHSTAVIASHAFHLGPKVQMESVHEGYDQLQEDELLRSSGWEEDGYRLYDISVFAGSSAAGWFAAPTESNALFASRSLWRRMGGYDPGFTSPGGGFVNHDALARAADLAEDLVLLLGEGTFHQFHQGIATNSLAPPMDLFVQEHQMLRGCPPGRRLPDPLYYGRINPHLRSSWESSAFPTAIDPARPVGREVAQPQERTGEEP